MSRDLDLETLTRPGGIVPVNVETTAELCRHVLCLREALLPFAEIAKDFNPALKDYETVTMPWAVPSVGAFRNALRALTQDQRKDAP